MIDLFGSYRVYFVAATLGAHSNLGLEGFRQKDLRFLLGLFLNWVDATTKGVDETIHNTQVARYLDALVRDGHAKKSAKGRSPHYQLTRSGLLELVTQLTKVPVVAPLEQFFFVYYFVRTYGERLVELVAQKENRLPRSFQVELAALLDHTDMIERQIRFVELEIKKLDGRLQDTIGASKAAQELSRKGVGTDAIIKDVAQRFPYELNSQKAMSELMYEIPPQLRLWELTLGNQNRAGFLWAPLQFYLRGYLETLRKLRIE